MAHAALGDYLFTSLSSVNWGLVSGANRKFLSGNGRWVKSALAGVAWASLGDAAGGAAPA